MTQPTSLDLMAFVDGELAEERVESMLHALSQDPSIAGQLLEQRRFKAACKRAGTALLDEAGTCPPELAEAVAKTLDQQLHEVSDSEVASAPSEAVTQSPAEPQTTRITPQETSPPVAPALSMADRDDGPSPLARIGFWGPLAAAAVLAIGVFLGSAISSSQPVTVSNLLPASMVSQMSQRHVTCADDPSELISDPSLPGNTTELPRALQTRYGGVGVNGLDLSSAGYRFDAVGKCSIPGGDAVHLIYKSAPESGFADTVSLWIRPLPEGEDAALAAGQVHMIKQDNCSAVYVWTQGEMIYYLAGDNPEHCSTVVETMTGQEI